jgi:hypothetical protein
MTISFKKITCGSIQIVPQSITEVQRPEASCSICMLKSMCVVGFYFGSSKRELTLDNNQVDKITADRK